MDGASTQLQPSPPPLRRNGVFNLGLQGRLVLSFVFLLMLGREADGLLYAHQTKQRMADLLGEQARQTSYGLSLASQQPLAAGQINRVNQMAKDLLRARNILFVVFYDPQFHPIVVAHRDPDYKATSLAPSSQRPSALMQTR